jgi:hypothetical protein
MKTKIVSSHTADFKPVKQEANGTAMLPSLVFPGNCNVSLTARLGFIVLFFCNCFFLFQTRVAKADDWSGLRSRRYFPMNEPSSPIPAGGDERRKTKKKNGK